MTSERDPSEARQRRTTTFLIVAILIMLLTLCGLGYFFFQVLRPPGEEIEVVTTTGDIRLEPIEEFYGFGGGISGQFKRPHDANVGPDGHVYVADTGNGRVVRLTRSGRFVTAFGDGTWGAGKLNSPSGVAVGADGRVYVADTGVHGPHGKVLILSADLAKVEKEIFLNPDDRPITPRILNGELYVTSRSGVHVYSLDGEAIRAWGSYGREVGQFSYPNGITALANGAIAVAESNNKRVQFFDVRGAPRSVVGTPPESMTDRTGIFDLPMGIATDGRNLLYLADAFDYSIRVLDSKGKELGKVGDYGSAKGQLNAPGGISHEGEGVFLVADELNNRIVRLKITIPESMLPSDATTTGTVGGPLGVLSGGRSWCLLLVPILLLLLALLAYSVWRRRGVRSGDDGDDEPYRGED